MALAFFGFAWTNLSLAQSPCVYREEEVSSPAASKDSITLLSVDPPEGAELRKDMVLTVEVQFAIANFEPDTYRIIPTFPTEGFGSLSLGDREDSPPLEHASGKVRLCVRLEGLYESPDVLWPLSMSVQLLKMVDANRSLSAAASRKVKFLSPDAPASTREALPDEYYDALQHTNSYFDTRLVLYKLCIARYPATQQVFTKAYRTWEARHRADIDLVAELQFERYKDMAKGRADHAALFADSATNGTREAYERFPPADLKRTCDSKLAELSDPDDTTDNVVGDAMAILRKYSSKVAERNKG
jgi:hypothetical protein